jgi:arylsulfatase
MVEHDDMVGGLLKRLDELGIANNTIVVYGTDNGAETGTWPDGGTMPFHGEKGTTWEGGFRVPMIVRWPGVIKPGTIVNEIFSQEDWLPTLLAAAGEPNIVEKVKAGYSANGKTGRPTSTATTSCRTSRARRPKDRARRSSISAKAVSSMPCGGGIGK